MMTFVTVSEAKSISEAAKRLGTTKSVVSHRVQQLENRLNTQLFERGRQLNITPSGHLFYEHCLAILSKVEMAEMEVTSLKDQLNGKLRISVPMAFSENCLYFILTQFALYYPDFELDIETTENFVNLNDENYDAAIRIGKLNSTSLIAKRISSSRNIICASPSYIKKFGQPKHPVDLQSHDGLLYILREPNGMLQLILDGELNTFRIRNRLRSNSLNLLLTATIEGLGIAILPYYLVSRYINSGELVVLLSDFSPLSSDISLIYRRSYRNHNKIKILFDFIQHSISNMDL